MADAYLTKSIQDNMLESFEAVENEIIGPGKHEQFLMWLRDMKEIYVKHS